MYVTVSCPKIFNILIWECSYCIIPPLLNVNCTIYFLFNALTKYILKLTFKRSSHSGWRERKSVRSKQNFSRAILVSKNRSRYLVLRRGTLPFQPCLAIVLFCINNFTNIYCDVGDPARERRWHSRWQGAPRPPVGRRGLEAVEASPDTRTTPSHGNTARLHETRRSTVDHYASVYARS